MGHAMLQSMRQQLLPHARNNRLKHPHRLQDVRLMIALVLGGAPRKADLGEGEDAVRDEVEAGLVHLARPLRLLGLQLLPQRIPDPQVDVPLPVALLQRGRHIGYGPLVHLPNLQVMTQLLGGKEKAAPAEQMAAVPL